MCSASPCSLKSSGETSRMRSARRNREKRFPFTFPLARPTDLAAESRFASAILCWRLSSQATCPRMKYTSVPPFRERGGAEAPPLPSSGPNQRQRLAKKMFSV